MLNAHFVSIVLFVSLNKIVYVCFHVRNLVHEANKNKLSNFLN